MTIKRQWLTFLMLTAVISVFTNTFLLSGLTDRYFKDYVAESYDRHLSQIVEYSKKALIEGNFSTRQMAVELEAHLVDPITQIKLYDSEGVLIADAGIADNMMERMMQRKMMGGHMMEMMEGGRAEEVDRVEIFDGDKLIGHLNIVRRTSIENSIEILKFKKALIANSMYSIAIVMAIATVIGVFISKKMSRDLINTAQMAQSIDLGNKANVRFAKVKEVRIIQQSLETLSSRLSLRQKSRKALVDELVHQMRTPLTILKTHLEGFEDGVIDMSSEEIRVCENQIENVTAIVSNMRDMIDAQRDHDDIHVEEFEFGGVIKQIVNGLRVQFEKKNILLDLKASQKVMLETDKYKLSQAIYNILTNAYKFTKENGFVKINYDVFSDRLIVNIEDSGIGIGKKDISKIFDAYYRSGDVEGLPGEGIGLYVVKENIQMIEGSIDVESKINEGSRFIIDIPLKI